MLLVLFFFFLIFFCFLFLWFGRARGPVGCGMWHVQVGGEHEGSRVLACIEMHWLAWDGCIGMDVFFGFCSGFGFWFLGVSWSFWSSFLQQTPKSSLGPSRVPARRVCLPASGLTVITSPIFCRHPFSGSISLRC